jgi:putative membrane protein
VPALSVVVGLILAFRTNTAYDRYWEGRKLWASLDVQIRNFSRMIWVGMKENHHNTDGTAPTAGSGSSRRQARVYAHQLFGRSNSSLKGKSGANGTAVAVTPVAKGNSNSASSVHGSTNGRAEGTLIEIDQDVHHDDDFEKVLVIRLLLAYAVSVKHHLRQEFGIHYYDLEQLLPEGYQPCAASAHIDILVPQEDKALGDRHRHYNEESWNIQSGNEEGQMSLPLEIAHGLSLWVIAESRAGRIESSLIGNLLSSINTMTDIFTNMERIVFTPIPLAYSIHL